MISVIVPAHRADISLERCLDALTQAAAGAEVIVVDDGSPGAAVAARAEAYGFRTIRLAYAHGPAVARNRGAEAATSPIVLFIDADIVVRPDTIARVREQFAAAPKLAALFGSYDTEPSAPQLVSQFKNLTHHYVHQQGREEAFTFWAGCGAVRRDIFLSLHGFSEGYGRPCIEDVELGYRLRRAGHRIALVKSLQVTHLKQWTLRGLVTTDVFDRGVPWTELILEHPDVPAGDLNLSGRARASLLLTWFGTIALLIGPLWTPASVAGLVGIGGVLLLDRRYVAWLAQVRGAGFAVRAVPLHLLYHLYSGVAGVIGVVRYVTRRGAGTPLRGVAASVGTGFAALAGGELVARAVGFVVTLYLARTLGVSSYGRIEVALAVFSYLQLLMDGGLDTIAVRTVARDPSARPRFAANLLGIRLVMALLLLAAVTLVTASSWSTSPVSTLVVRYALAVLPLAASFNWAFQADQHMRAVAARTIVSQLAYAGLVLTLVHGPGDVATVALTFVAGTALGIALLAGWYARRFGRPRIALERRFLAEILPQAWPVAVSGAFRTLSYNFDLLIIGFVFPSLGAGLYAAAYRLLTLPLLGYATLGTALLPMLARLHGRARQRTAAAHAALVIVSGLTIAVLVHRFAEPLLVVTAGPAYGRAAPILALLAWSIPLTALSGVFRLLLLATHRQRQDLAVVTTAGLVNVALNLVLIPRLGLAGAAVATIAGEGVVLLLAAAFVVRAGFLARLGYDRASR